jgi:hypothetical protein
VITLFAGTNLTLIQYSIDIVGLAGRMMNIIGTVLSTLHRILRERATNNVGRIHDKLAEVTGIATMKHSQDLKCIMEV